MKIDFITWTIIIMAILLLFIWVGFFTNGLDAPINFLDCMALKEDTVKCNCFYVWNVCYQTEGTTITFNSDTNETIIKKYPVKNIFWKNGEPLIQNG